MQPLRTFAEVIDGEKRFAVMHIREFLNIQLMRNIRTHEQVDIYFDKCKMHRILHRQGRFLA